MICFFWIGKDSTQDEYGTAAYKTVELDDYINYHTGSDPIQHREIEGAESQAFLALFPKGLTCLKGGHDTGFRHVEAAAYKPRLLHVKGKKNCVVREVECTTKAMNKGDIFILDIGLEIMQWIGSGAGLGEKSKAVELVNKIREERNGKPTIQVFDEKLSPPNKKFWEYISGNKNDIANAIPDDPPCTLPKKMLRISDAQGGAVTMTACEFGRSYLQTDDAFVVDLGDEIYVWVGKGANAAEKANGLPFATKYIIDAKRPKKTPIIVIPEGSHAHCKKFNDSVGFGPSDF